MLFLSSVQRWTSLFICFFAVQNVQASSHLHHHNHKHSRRVPDKASEMTSPKVFNPSASDNLVVYYGATPNTTASGLLSICQNPNVAMVVMAFVYEYFGPNGYPSATFGPGCSGQTQAQMSIAPGLQDCQDLGTQIKQCQSLGTKILVSIGGATSTSSFANVTQARQFATTLWNLFGAGTGAPKHIRPFGAVVVDGFDIDSEDREPGYYANFVTALRNLYSTQPSRRFFVTASPQCPYPDMSIPQSALYLCDFVFVQFYNNYCNLGTSYFLNIFQQWSNDFATSKPSPGPKLYIGAAASRESAGSGYIVAAKLGQIIAKAKNLNVPNLGGMSLWDGTNALNNVDSAGQNYLAVAKAAIS